MTATTKARRRPLTLADLTEEKRRGLCVAVHEAGHAVAATVLGGRITAAVLGDGKTFGVLGRTVHRTVPEGTWPSILYAGPWAEARFIAGRRPSQRQLFAVLDGSGHLDSKALCAAAAADVYGDTSAEARLTVPTLLERAWPSVISVAQTIHRTGEARHDDVCEALGITDGGGLTSTQLANLRAGLRSVPPFATDRQRVTA
ncbi:hypothetical protein KUF57_12950 [Mycolicibacterium sp. PAM1]|uniref:hypothetical protein n=1 Tax=Mycolicibacterium sp. PAM1 TaxID=2853535 RepID=UPI001C3E4A8B|nr:hypothetical protein [Mycolicibacterium sp. PAM1]MBV5244441.1 hypothetical protein [Mycolicibacterium sp. PAM1]